METSERLKLFYETISQNTLIGASHVSLYFALVSKIVGSGNAEVGYIYRTEILQMARISRRTYNKCMRDLKDLGYISYDPSTNSFTGSKVCLKKI